LLRPAILVTHPLRGGGTNESVLQLKAGDITSFKQDGHELLLWLRRELSRTANKEREFLPAPEGSSGRT
jgi:hypothetical protein